MDSIKIKRTNSSSKDFVHLITQLDKDLSDRYHHEQKKYDKHNIIELTNTAVVVYKNDEPIGCGCFKLFDDTSVEIKRMFIHPDFRGKGISKSLLKELENWAGEIGFSRLVLETGRKQPEAIGLYENFGFNRIENYGQYSNLPNSLCFEKILNI